MQAGGSSGSGWLWFALPSAQFVQKSSLLVGGALRQVLLPCAAALIVALFSLALILFWSQQEEVLGTDEMGASITISAPSSSTTGTAQATGRGGRRGLLASLGLGILETLSGTPWTREGGEGVGGASEQDCGVLSSTKVGSVQARTRGATGGRGKDEMGP